MPKGAVVAMCSFATWAMGLGVVAVSASAQAQSEVRLESLSRLRIDGMLRDWHGVTVSHLGSAPDRSMEYAFAYDEAAITVGVRVHDTRFVRTERRGPDEDAVVLTFANAERRATEVWLFAGRTGESAASVGISDLGGRPRRIADIEIVEGPAADPGYELEARIPWAMLRAAGDWDSGRLAIRLHDVDSETRPRVEVLASAVVDSGSLESLPPLRPIGGIYGLWSTFRREHDLLAVEPRYDFRANVAQSPEPERVAVIDRFVFVAGRDFHGAESCAYVELSVPSGESVLRAEVANAPGAEYSDLVVWTRFGADGEARSVYRVNESGIVRVAYEPPAEPSAAEVPPTRAPIATAAPRATIEAPRVTATDLVRHALASIGIDPSSRARFTIRRSVTESAAEESIALYERHLIITGPEFREGTGYFHFELPVERPEDILWLQAVELSGDSRAELAIQIARRAPPNVHSEVLLFYAFDPNGDFRRVGAIEVRRGMDSREVLNEIAFQSNALVVRPGVAVGYDDTTWPFVEGETDVMPLLLPWRDRRSMRYRVEDGRLRSF